MNLHRVDGDSEWSGLDPKTWNGWQRLANQTKGAITPGNAITLLGLGLTAVGTYYLYVNELLIAAGLLMLGRVLDVADGWVADKTGTKSAFGEAFDAGVDKIVTIGVVLVLLVMQILPIWLLTGLLGLQLANVVVIAYKRSKGVKTHSTLIGKYSMAMVWLSLVGLILALAVSGPVGAIVEIVAYVAAVLSIALGVLALRDYISMR